MIVLLLACRPPATVVVPPAAPREVPWRRGLPPVEGVARTITHLHSPWSHDACDGDPLPDGRVNEPCLEDFRSGLCEAGIDVAFVTDHPNHAAAQAYGDLHHARPGDTVLPDRNGIVCADGRTVWTFPGFEDELMPLGLAEHVPGTAAERNELLNRYDETGLVAMVDAGAEVFVAHTEGRLLPDLEALQDAGLRGIEIWNLHAMFAPDIREDDLGLDGLGWAADIGPFTRPTTTAEPDLFVIGVLQLQRPSLERFDALLARGPMVGIVGTDAHQNVLNLELADGERGDSYRRSLRWMSNLVQAGPDEDVSDALAAGRSIVAFEILGTPVGFDFRAPDAQMGGSSTARSLEIQCPTLHPESPQGVEAPEITVHLVKDGARIATGCGTHELDGPGVYRVEVEIVPLHLRPFLGDDPEPYLRPFPWILSNAIRVVP